MIRHPPKSTLFPTRRSSDLSRCSRRAWLRRGGRWEFSCCSDPPVREKPRPLRSEEHTSELQSLRHLVCRLLLEKKKCSYTPCLWHNPKRFDGRLSSWPSVAL